MPIRKLPDISPSEATILCVQMTRKKRILVATIKPWPKRKEQVLLDGLRLIAYPRAYKFGKPSDHKRKSYKQVRPAPSREKARRLDSIERRQGNLPTQGTNTTAIAVAMTEEEAYGYRQSRKKCDEKSWSKGRATCGYSITDAPVSLSKTLRRRDLILSPVWCSKKDNTTT